MAKRMKIMAQEHMVTAVGSGSYISLSHSHLHNTESWNNINNNFTVIDGNEALQ